MDRRVRSLIQTLLHTRILSELNTTLFVRNFIIFWNRILLKVFFVINEYYTNNEVIDIKMWTSFLKILKQVYVERLKLQMVLVLLIIFLQSSNFRSRSIEIKN